jgi:DNA-binding NarL/FixJ family response regulator
MKKITVLLAEDHMIVREGFRKMLELEDDSKSSAKPRTDARRSRWPKNFGPPWC